MNEQFELILNYVRAVWRLRWLALVTATLLCGVGWFAVLTLPNEYEVKAKIYVDTDTMLRPLLQGIAVGDDLNVSNARLIRRTLLVRPNLETVARQTDMDINAKSPRAYEQLLATLSRKIRVSGSTKSNIYVVAYRDSDAKLATRVVEAVLNIFVEHSLGESRRDASKSREFIEAQIREHEKRLSEAEERRKEFKRQNVGRMPSQGQDYYYRLEALRRKLSDAELALNEAKNKELTLRARLNREAQGTSEDEGAGHRGPATPYDQRIVNLETKLDSLLLQYTDAHPDVISTLRLLAELQSRREAYLVEIRKQLEEAGPDQVSSLKLRNPLYQQLSLTHAQVKANVAALETRVAEYRVRESELAKLVDTIPAIEAELKRLDRDYNIIKSNFEKLVARLESLKIGGEAAESTDEIQFNVIDPPRVPLVPVGPDRPRFSIMVLAGGLMGGVGITVLLAMLRPTIYTRDALREITDLPVFGVVSRLWTPRERFKRRMEVSTFALGCMCLLAIFAGLMTMYSLNLDLDVAARLARLTQRYL